MAATLSSDSDGLRWPLLPPAKKPKTTEKICIDDMLQKYCGEFGRWQLKHFIFTSFAWVLMAFHSMVMIFADHEPDWRCVSGPGCTATSICSLSPGDWEWIGGSGTSTVSEWGLICSEKYKVGFVHSLFFVGSMIGAGIFGHLSDSFLGRKGSLAVVCALNAIFGCLTALSHNFWIYALLRFLTGFSNGGVGLCAFVLATEPVGPNKRSLAGMSTFYFFSGGIAILTGIAYIFPKWRHLYVASSVPSFLYIALIIPFLSESPRWYLVRGRVSEAMKLMSNIASFNGKYIPEGFVVALDKEVSATREDVSIGSNLDQTYKNECLENKEAVAGSIVDVIRCPTTRIRLFLSVTINFVCALVYYGLNLNVENLKVNLYLSVMLNAVGEMPAFLITAVLVERLGRKPMMIGTMWFSGFFCLIASVMSDDGVWKVMRMVCSVLGIFGMAGTYNLLFVYAAELFPTVVRNAALGCTTQAAQMGAILAPLAVVLGGSLSFAVFATCGIVGALFVFYLPETLNMPLYDTFNGLEAGIA